MKRYSIAPSSARKSAHERPSAQRATLELERLEQEVTLVLQEIDKNLSRANTTINDKIFPVIRQYAAASDDVWRNVDYWKRFFESAANAEIASYESPTVGELSQNLLVESHDESRDEVHEMAPLKRPYLKGNIEESTPTWSTEQRGGGGSRTPQVNQSPKKDSTVTYTIRQSLDNYQRVTISPKKARLQTPNDRRSSMIQDLINSSPTLPEPPVLMSELGRDDEPVREELGRLSPIDVTDHEVGDGIQRFPTTPQFSRHSSRRTSAVKTPVRAQDDTEPRPPVAAVPSNDNDNDDDEVPFPDLETIELKKQVEQVKRRKLDEHPEDNVFLDTDRSKNNSIVSTVYHSILNQQGSPGSKENTNKSISNLFDDVLEDLRDKDKPANEEDHSSHNTSELGSVLNERFKKFLGQ